MGIAKKSIGSRVVSFELTAPEDNTQVSEAQLSEFITELAETQNYLAEVAKFAFMAKNKKLSDEELTGILMTSVMFNGQPCQVCTCVTSEDVRDFRANKLNRLFA